MAEFMVLFGAGLNDEGPQGDIVEQIEAFLPIQFPDDQFRFAMAPDRSGIAVLPITGHQELAGSNLGEIVLAVEEIVRRKSRSAAL